MKKRILSIVIVCALIFSITACGKNGNAGDSSGSDNTPTEAADAKDGLDTTATAEDDGFNPLKEKVTINIGKNESTADVYEAGDSSNDNYVLRYFEEKLNVDYNYAWTAGGDDAYNQKSSLVIATGELPDVMTVTEAQLRQYLFQNILLTKESRKRRSS